MAGLHGWQLKFQKDISAARGFPLSNVVSKPQAGHPSLTALDPKKNPDNIQL